MKQKRNQKLNEELNNEEMMGGTGGKAEPEEETISLWKELLSWVKIIVAAVLISLFLTKVVLVNALVPSSSMETLISPGDRLFGNRLAYKFGDPERFDVVIFKYPVDESENYIKRVIGLPGETVQIQSGRLTIDGKMPDGLERVDLAGLAENPVVLKKDEYFLLGDNRENSEDSRFPNVGNVKRRQIKGRVWLRIKPLSRFGLIGGKWRLEE